MHYRAQGLDWISRIGYAVSEDGIHWNRMRDPIFVPQDARDARGIEDPRVTQLGNTFYMTYTAYGSEFYGQGEPTHLGGGVIPMFAKSENLITWERLGPLVVGEDNKDHILFPRQINGRYALLHRRSPNIWLAESEDLKVWPEEWMRPLFGPRAENGWDSLKVGGGGVPIETEFGWLIIYHAYDSTHTYRLGTCLLDLENPAVVIHRPGDFIFEPVELWEIKGDVPNVVFSSANLVVGNLLYVYYGAADHLIALATVDLKEILNFARFG